MQCGTQAADDVKFCAECGLQFSFVGEAEVSLTEVAEIAPANVTSGWIKIGAASLVLLTAMFGCQQFNASKLADCRSQALQTNSLGRVLDVRLSGLQCEYLIQMSTFGVIEPRPAEWMPQSSFETLLLTRADDAPNP
jgi:hypothetical protein